jgi:hypothetical protein
LPVRTIVIFHKAAIPMPMILAAKVGGAASFRAKIKTAFVSAGFKLTALHRYGCAAVGAYDFDLAIGHTAGHATEKEFCLFKTQRIHAESMPAVNTPDIWGKVLASTLAPSVITLLRTKRVIIPQDFMFDLLERDSALFTYNRLGSAFPSVGLFSPSVLCYPFAIASLVAEVMGIISQAIGSTLKWFTAIITWYGCSVSSHNKSLLPRFDSWRSCLGSACDRRPESNYTISGSAIKDNSLDADSIAHPFLAVKRKLHG